MGWHLAFRHRGSQGDFARRQEVGLYVERDRRTANLRRGDVNGHCGTVNQARAVRFPADQAIRPGSGPVPFSLLPKVLMAEAPMI